MPQYWPSRCCFVKLRRGQEDCMFASAYVCVEWQENQETDKYDTWKVSEGHSRWAQDDVTCLSFLFEACAYKFAWKLQKETVTKLCQLSPAGAEGTGAPLFGARMAFCRPAGKPSRRWWSASWWFSVCLSCCRGASPSRHLGSPTSF